MVILEILNPNAYIGDTLLVANEIEYYVGTISEVQNFLFPGHLWEIWRKYAEC